MRHGFNRQQVKRIIFEELENSKDEEDAIELLQRITGLNEDETDEFENKLKRARSFKKNAGISLLGAVVILFGGMNLLGGPQEQRVKQDMEKVQQLDDETLRRFGVDTGAMENPDDAAEERGKQYPTAKLGLVNMSDMDNNEKIEAAWKQIDDMVANGELQYKRARVSTTVPGGMATLDYDAIPPNLVLPNSLGTKDQYRAWIVQTILKGDIKNIGKLRDFVYGDSGKWPSGSGEEKTRYVGSAQILPPEWTVALDIYQDLIREITDSMATEYRTGDESQKKEILRLNNVKSPEELEKYLNTTLYRAGLQPVSLTTPN